MNKIILIFLLLLLVACPDSFFTDPTLPSRDCYQTHISNVTKYKINPTYKTKTGIRVDSNTYKIDEDILTKIDAKVLAVEKCLNKTVKRECLIVKIPDDIYLAKCTNQVLFPCSISKSVCEKKEKAGQIKFLPGVPCTKEPIGNSIITHEYDWNNCHCRAAIQDENVIVTVPSLIVFASKVVMLVMNSSNPWETPELSKCSNL